MIGAIIGILYSVSVSQGRGAYLAFKNLVEVTFTVKSTVYGNVFDALKLLRIQQFFGGINLLFQNEFDRGKTKSRFEFPEQDCFAHTGNGTQFIDADRDGIIGMNVIHRLRKTIRDFLNFGAFQKQFTGIGAA